MKKMGKVLILFLLIVCFPTIVSAKWGTPYHLINENNYESVIKALGSPANKDRTIMRVATYMRHNFVNESDEIQFGVIEYWQSGKEMFYNAKKKKDEKMKGDCEDFDAMPMDAFRFHNIPAVSWGSWSSQLPYGHAFITVPYKGKWAFFHNSSQVIHEGFSSQEEITDNFWERWGYTTSESIPINLPQGGEELNLTPKFTNSSRLAMHSHLTECEGNHLEIIFPVNDRNKSFYSKLSNKEAMGFLLKTNFLKMKAVGFSYSEHGWYSPSREFNDRMYTAHILFSRIGFNIYTGDYQGAAIDVNPIDLNWTKVFVCCRNFGEVWDYKAIFEPIKFVGGEVEINDRKFVYNFYLKFYQALDSYTKVGWNSEKEFKIELCEKNIGCSIAIGEYCKLTLNFGW